MRAYYKTARTLLCVGAGLLMAIASALGDILTINPPDDLKNVDQVAQKFVSCFVKGGEMLLTSENWRCVAFGVGATYYKGDQKNGIKAIEPNQFDPSVACLPQDKRRIPTGTIQKIIESLKPANNAEPAATGKQQLAIRIIGGAYCQDELDLINLDLPYPLVLDYSVFRYGIRADNFHTSGHFSVDGAFVFENLTFGGHSRIGGSFFGDDAFIQGLRIIDTDIGGDINLNRSILNKYLIIDRVTALGGLKTSDSALSSFLVSGSKFGDRLTLNGSEALCRYYIRDSEFGELYASDSGFGTAASPGNRRDWSAAIHRNFARIFGNIAVQTALKNNLTCNTPDAEFLLVDTTVHSACLKSFRWISAPAGTTAPRTVITLDGINVARNLNLDLWDGPSSTSNSRVLQIIGTTTDTLIFDFSRDNGGYDLYVDRLKANRLQDANIACGKETGVEAYDLPSIFQVEKWLKRNKAPTTEPFLSFSQAFERFGADSTNLKVAKASLEYRTDLKATWTELKSVIASKNLGEIVSYFLSPNRLLDVLRLSINAIVGFAADYGYRSYKSILVIVALVLAFNFYILNSLKVAYAISEIEGRKFAIGPYYIFDVMIPLYNIEPMHAKIKEFYFADESAVDATTRERLERALWWLRLVGLGAVVFLSATLKASVVG